MTFGRTLLVAALLCGWTPPTTASPATVLQDDFTDVDLRVSAVAPGGVVVVDRGSRDGLAIGDRVRLYPRGGDLVQGVVTEVDERSAVVDLARVTSDVELGTRGEVQVPTARLDELAAAAALQQTLEDPTQALTPDPEAGQQALEHEPWENQDPEWNANLPLLAKVKPVRPEERPRNTTGRVYVIGDLVDSKAKGFPNGANGFLNSYARMGTDFVIENPFGRGGGLRLGAEVNYQTELNDIAGWDLLVRRMSYFKGGTRFEGSRLELGRFLQNGMPEFGILDGVEWGRRRPNGDRFGFSLGAMPELNLDHESFDDLQAAAYYNWAVDEQEQLTIGGGYQKTVHDGKSDRDLLVAKARYLPLGGWDFNGTMWVDFYTGSDNLKTSFAEITQAVASMAHRWENGNMLDLNYQRIAYPELLRDEFAPGLITDLFDYYNDRVGLDGWWWITDRQQFHARTGVWSDQDDAGGDVQLGFNYRDLFFSKSRTDVSVYGIEGKFSTVVGARGILGQTTGLGRWDLSYDFSVHRQDGFSNNIDDIVQHRLRGSQSWFWKSGWSLSLYAQGFSYDEAFDWSTGFYMQKVF